MACVGAIGYTLSPIAEIAFHPYGIGMVAFGALFLLVGALFVKPRRAAAA
jgi:hypothetical protein